MYDASRHTTGGEESAPEQDEQCEQYEQYEQHAWHNYQYTPVVGWCCKPLQEQHMSHCIG